MKTIAQTGVAETATRLLLAFELGQRVWKLGFSVGLGQRPRIRQIPAGAVGCLVTEIAQAKRRLHVSPDAPVISCYEAGRDGFWLDRYLQAQGLTNYVVDSASIEVDRRARRLKTDRLDLQGLLNLVARFVMGDRRVWRAVRVPTVQEEDARQLQRARTSLQQDRTRVINRVKGLLATHGLTMRLDATFLTRLSTVRLWDGAPMPAGLRHRLTIAWRQLEYFNGQLRELDTAQLARVNDTSPDARLARQLQTLRGIGEIGAWVLTTEVFAWRRIRNRRELGALAGLAPAVYQSGESRHELGITRAGNRHVRRTMVQLAWGWLRYQPASTLSHWYRARFGKGGRLRRIGIVALARKLLVALWHYLSLGAIPAGAVVKPQVG